MKRGKENDTKGIWGSWDGQTQGKSETYGGEQDLEAENKRIQKDKFVMVKSEQEAKWTNLRNRNEM